jgi:DNA-binding transcriptional ArsR family regulator
MAGKHFKVRRIKRVVTLGKALSVERRIRILLAVANDGPASATLLAKLGHDDGYALSNLSYHLVKLFEAGLLRQVKVREGGRGAAERHYGLTKAGRKMVALIAEIGK